MTKEELEKQMKEEIINNPDVKGTLVISKRIPTSARMKELYGESYPCYQSLTYDTRTKEMKFSQEWIFGKPPI